MKIEVYGTKIVPFTEIFEVDDKYDYLNYGHLPYDEKLENALIKEIETRYNTPFGERSKEGVEITEITRAEDRNIIVSL